MTERNLKIVAITGLALAVGAVGYLFWTPFRKPLTEDQPLTMAGGSLWLSHGLVATMTDPVFVSGVPPKWIWTYVNGGAKVTGVDLAGFGKVNGANPAEFSETLQPINPSNGSIAIETTCVNPNGTPMMLTMSQSLTASGPLQMTSTGAPYGRFLKVAPGLGRHPDKNIVIESVKVTRVNGATTPPTTVEKIYSGLAGNISLTVHYQ